MADNRKMTRVKRDPKELERERTREVLARGNGPRNTNLRMADPNYREPEVKTRQQRQREILEGGMSNRLNGNTDTRKVLEREFYRKTRK